MAGHVRSQLFLQAWVLLACLVLVATYIAHDQGYFQQVIEADASRLCILIAGLFLGASAHAAWHVVRVTRQLGAAAHWLAGGTAAPMPGSGPDHEADYVETPGLFVHRFVGDVLASRRAAGLKSGEPPLVLEVYADRLRAPVDIGWYLVDILIRLGLVGTIIGFILILGTLSSGPAPTPENIQTLLISMSGGMGVALYTTLAGLVTAMALGAQYMVLGRGTEELIALLVRIRDKAGAP